MDDQPSAMTRVPSIREGDGQSERDVFARALDPAIRWYMDNVADPASVAEWLKKRTDSRDESERAFDAAYYPARDDLAEFETWCRENGHEEALHALSEYRVDNEVAAAEMGGEE